MSFYSFFFFNKIVRSEIALKKRILSSKKLPEINDLSIFVIVPAFIISELKTAFQIGFLLFIPFVVIDLVISNILVVTLYDHEIFLH